jgi:hypothetical protein
MSTSASIQTVLTVVKDEFAEVLTEGTLSPNAKPADWNVIITEKTLLEATRMPSPPPEETQHGLAALYDNTFPTHKEYHEFAVNRLAMWGNTLDYKLFDTLYLTHRYHARTIKNLREQAKALLEEADKINEQDKMVRHEIESHVQTITRSDLRQQIKKPQRVRVIVSPTPLPSSSRRPDYSHLAIYTRNYARQQYQCFECGNPTLLNGIVLSTHVKPASKQHLDMHHELAMDASMTTEFVAIMTQKANMMVTLQENAKSPPIVCTYLFFQSHSKDRTIPLLYKTFPLLSFFPKLQTNYSLCSFLPPPISTPQFTPRLTNPTHLLSL